MTSYRYQKKKKVRLNICYQKLQARLELFLDLGEGGMAPMAPRKAATGMVYVCD